MYYLKKFQTYEELKEAGKVCKEIDERILNQRGQHRILPPFFSVSQRESFT